MALLSDIIRERLNQKFYPDYLVIIDDSAKHVGHSGNKTGAAHYRVMITSKLLQNKTRVGAHREIYQVLADLIPTKIHALQIKILS